MIGGEISYPELNVLVMEDLSSYQPIDRYTRLKPEHKAYLVRTLREAVAVLRLAGVVHGDLKPDNILMNNDLDIRIVDYSISALVGGYHDDTKIRHGNPGYTSRNQKENGPEKFDDDRHSIEKVFKELQWID